MKTRFYILVILMALIFPTTNLMAEQAPSVGGATELPSSSYLNREKRSIANSETTSALAAPVLGLARPYATAWEDPFLPGTGGETSPTGPVGAPIGDISLPVLLLAFIVYFVYRAFSTSPTTSRRKGNL